MMIYNLNIILQYLVKNNQLGIEQANSLLPAKFPFHYHPHMPEIQQASHNY